MSLNRKRGLAPSDIPVTVVSVKPLLAFALLVSFPLAMLHAKDVDEDYPTTDLIHSPLPLYNFNWEGLWPRSFTAPDIIAGCESRVRFGDWRFDPAPQNEFDEERWYRFSNYGTFHCSAILRANDERSDLDTASWQYGFFVKLGETSIAGHPFELWAIQEGTRPGSDYILLSRARGDDPVTSFTMLQQRCPKANIIGGGDRGLDTWATSYCSINTRTGLLALARKMAKLTPAGTITLVRDDEKGPDSASSPSKSTSDDD